MGEQDHESEKHHELGNWMLFKNNHDSTLLPGENDLLGRGATAARSRTMSWPIEAEALVVPKRMPQLPSPVSFADCGTSNFTNLPVIVTI